jgi:hypothetical protein
VRHVEFIASYWSYYCFRDGRPWSCAIVSGRYVTKWTVVRLRIMGLIEMLSLDLY